MSVNHKSADNFSMKVQLSQTEAESKRLILAFESRQNSEISWALNTLTLYSCNTSQNFTLETQPFLLESLANYMIFCIENIHSLDYSDPFAKRGRTVNTSAPTFVDAFSNPNDHNHGTNALDYNSHGMYTQDLKKRDLKFDEKLAARKGFTDPSILGG